MIVFVVLLLLFVLQVSMETLLPQNNGLVIDTLSRSVVAGSYTEPFVTGRGIQFITRSDGSLLVLSTPKGRVIINIDTTVHDEGLMKSRLIELKGRHFLQGEDAGSGDHEFHIQEDMAMKIRLHGSNKDKERGTLITEILERLYNEDETQHRNAVKNTILSLLVDKHLTLILDAVKMMGERKCLTGKDYPALFPLYMMAQQLKHLATRKNIDNDDPYALNQDHKKCNSWKTCPPCTNIHCPGLCGSGCNCWVWVCGDCCFHVGCYIHDLICKKNAWSVQCVFGALTAPLKC